MKKMQPRNESNIPPYYTHVYAENSQNNFQQQQQHQQQNPQPLQHNNFTPFNINQPGSSVQNQPHQLYHSDFFGNQQPATNTHLLTNHYQPTSHLYSSSPGMQNQNYCGSSPQNIMDHFRSCMNTSSPIFILPSACPSPSQHPPATPQQQMQPTLMMGQNMTYPMNYPQMGMPYPQPPAFCCPPFCIPYPLPTPIYNPFSQDRQKEKSQNCECCQKSNTIKDNFKNSNIFNDSEEHKCKETKDDTICSKKNCPSALNLQALASQFLSIQGIIPCVATRLVLRKVPGSNITTNFDEIIERAQKAINQLNKDQLLTESRNAQQVNALINLHMTANPPQNIIPVLTMIQLKVNLLKAQVENLINRKLMENQGIGAEGACNFDPLVLSLKTDEELREFLAVLRQKECEERVNLNFAPYHAQRVIAQSHLTNIQNKISQVEAEMERRRSISMSRTPLVNKTHQCSDPFSNFYSPTFVVPQIQQNCGGFPKQTYESPDPFIIQVRSPKRLNLKPHVGSPETTYERPKEVGKDLENSCSKISRQSQDNSHCPCQSHSSTCTVESIQSKKKLRKKPKKSSRSTLDDNNDNYDDETNNKVSCPKSSSNIIVNIITDSGKESINRNSSLNMNKTDTQFLNILSNDASQDIGFQEKCNFEENNSQKKIKCDTIPLKEIRESSDFDENVEFVGNSTSEKKIVIDNESEEKSKEKNNNSEEMISVNSKEI